MIQAYIKFWKGYADFRGKTNVRDYWLAWLANFIVSMIFIIPGAIMIGANISKNVSIAAFVLLMIVYPLAAVVPSLAAIVRRLRDA